jgi:hypothetical protein
MNERIKNLLSQANIYDGRDSLYWCEEKNLTEFAELIVRECAKTVNDTEYPYEDPAHKETWDACCVWSAEKLKEHFGVEE